MFLEVGKTCYYVPEDMGRGPLFGTVVEVIPYENTDGAIFLVSLHNADRVLKDEFFAEITHLSGLQSPDSVIPIRAYIKFGAWFDMPKFGEDVVEFGFLCTLEGVSEAFPNLADRHPQAG
jgi:hypothetical protein